MLTLNAVKRVKKGFIMDKRVIMIIAILIVGISCMYVIVDNSTSIGKAITTFSKTSITLPNGFSVGETDSKSAQLYNKRSNEKINIYDLGKGDSTKEKFKNVTDIYKNNPDLPGNYVFFLKKIHVYVSYFTFQFVLFQYKGNE